MSKVSLKKLFAENMEPRPMQVNRDEFMEAVRKYSAYKESFLGPKELKKKLDEIRWLVQAAEQVTLQETQDWFDEITVSRHMKQLKESYKVLEKTCGELVQHQQRFESAYNDIGRILENYYEL